VKDRGLRLRERDLGILLALAKMRLLRTSDLARLHFSAVGTCQKRLRKLYDAGLVKTLVPDLAAENRYALTPLGHALLLEALPDTEVPEYRSAPRVDRRNMRHLDMLNEYRIALARSAPPCGVELRRFVPEWELRSRDPDAGLVPDATIQLRAGGKRLGVALEVDAATESPGIVAKKVQRYGAARMMERTIFGLRAPVVLIVTTTLRRARSLAKVVLGAGVPVLLSMMSHARMDGCLKSGSSSPRVVIEAASAEAVVFRTGLLACPCWT
jgi:DNA-binding PadR family transcriptional regulator